MNTENKWKLWINPFSRIAGAKALTWGLGGMIVSILVSYAVGLHYHGLLHYGGAPNNQWWCFVVEHLVVWLVPVLLFYIGGKLLSKSHIRFIDVLGTVAFAQLPFVIMNLFYLPVDAQYILHAPLAITPEWFTNPQVVKGLLWIMPTLLFAVWTCVLMFWAFRVSCNLKGVRAGLTYAIVLIGGDILCRYLIGLMY